MKKVLAFLSTFLSGIFLGSCSSGVDEMVDPDRTARESGNGSEIKVAVTLPMASCAIPVKETNSDVEKDLSVAIEKHAPSSLKTLALKMLESPLMKVEVWPKERIPSELLSLLEYTGSTAEEMKTVREAKKFIVIHAVGRPGWPPAHEFGIRTAAASLALELKSTVLDLYMPAFVHLDQAFDTLPPKEDPPKLSSWLKVLTSSGEKGIWLTSRGLARVGLPELQSIDVPPQIENSLTYVMTGLAWKIIKTTQVELHQDTKELYLSAVIEVTDKDIDEAFGKKVTTKTDTAASFHLRMKKGSDGADYLTIVKPGGDMRTNGVYLADQMRQLMGASSEPAIETTKTDAMEKAMVLAVSELPMIRERFISGRLPNKGKLILKFKVTRGADREYLWASVTAWKELDKIDCYCGNDSRFDPKLRAGKQLTLSLDSIVDWAVMVNDDIVEGAYTNKVLEQEKK